MGINLSQGEIIVNELVDRYVNQKRIVRCMVRPAFQMAFSEEIIRRNPFDFRLDFLPNNTQKRVALTEKQQEQLLDFIAQDDYYCQYYDEILWCCWVPACGSVSSAD